MPGVKQVDIAISISSFFTPSSIHSATVDVYRDSDLVEGCKVLLGLFDGEFFACSLGSYPWTVLTNVFDNIRWRYSA